MDSRELMTGNFLIAEGHYVEVNEIYDHGIHAFNGENEENHAYDHLRPIPLTEDILIRCGFKQTPMEYNYDNDYCKDYMYRNGDLEIIVSDEGKFTYVYNFYSDQYGTFALGKEVTELHALQNLIWVICKQKITLK